MSKINFKEFAMNECKTLKCASCFMEQYDVTDILQLKVDLVATIGRREAWGMFNGILPLIISFLSLFVSLFNIVNVFSKDNLMFVQMICLFSVIMIIISCVCFLFCGDKGRYCKALECVVLYLNYYNNQSDESDKDKQIYEVTIRKGE